VKTYRVPILIAVALISVLAAIAVIVPASGGSEGVSASELSSPTLSISGSEIPALDEEGAVVATTLPLFHRFDGNYVRGAEPASGGVETLRRLGIKTVVDLRSVYDHTDDAGLAIEAAGLRYYWLPMGVWNPPSDDQAREFVSVVSDQSKGPFYVFCSDGLHRTGEMSAIYRVAHCGWSVERALKETDEIGFNPYYYTLRGYVWTYARKFNPQAVPRQARRVSAFE
jgi:hypothetical protein